MLRRLSPGVLVSAPVLFAAMVAFAMLAVASAPVGSALAADASTTTAVPPAFVVAASNGFNAEVIGGYNPKLELGSVIVLLNRKIPAGSENAVYFARAKATETSIEADLGPLGEIDVHSVPTGGTTTQKAPCGGDPVTFPSGRWEGTVRFRGEEGFTSFEASSVAASARPLLALLCGEERNEGIGGHSPGALLELHRRHGGERIELTVRKNKRAGPTRIGARSAERRGGVGIERDVAVVGPSKAFDLEIPPDRATVEPPSPFSGSLSFMHRPSSSPLVTGNLKVDLPGRRAVPILGSGSLHASLVRAVLNPSHPF